MPEPTMRYWQSTFDAGRVIEAPSYPGRINPAADPAWVEVTVSPVVSDDVIEEAARVFRDAWHAADDRGEVGGRVNAGVSALAARGLLVGLPPDVDPAPVGEDVTGEACIEAERRWGADIIEHVPAGQRTPQQWLDIGMAGGFVLGAQWAAALPAGPRTVTSEQREAMARAIYEAERDAHPTPQHWLAWPGPDDEIRNAYLPRADTALAALGFTVEEGGHG